MALFFLVFVSLLFVFVGLTFAWMAFAPVDTHAMRPLACDHPEREA